MHLLNAALLLLAKSSSSTPRSDAKGYSLSWAVVLAGLILGLAVTLSPGKRTAEIKHTKED